MEKSHLPLLRKKKMSKGESSGKEKDSPKKEKDKSQGKCVSGKDGYSKEQRGISPVHHGALKPKPTIAELPVVSGDGGEDVVKNDLIQPLAPVDWEWSKYLVKDGQPSDDYQKFVPEKLILGGRLQEKTRLAPKSATPTYQLPHPVRNQWFAGKPNSLDGYSPTIFPHKFGIHSPNQKRNQTVFNFDFKHLNDPDSSPIYHELDPPESYNQSAHHTYQSITEVREELDRLQAKLPCRVEKVPSFSGAAQLPVQENSGLTSSSAQNASSKRNLSKTLPSNLSKATAASKNLSLLPSPCSPTAPPHTPRQASRSQSIFSRLWLQKKGAHGLKDGAARNNGTVATSPTTRNLALEAICIDVPSVPKLEKNYSTLYAVTSPPPVNGSAFTNYCQRLNNVQNNLGVAEQSQDFCNSYGMNIRRNYPTLCGNAKRSFSDSTASPPSRHKSKTGGKSGIAYENQLPWRNGSVRSFADRTDVVSFGEPVASPVAVGGSVSLGTFKSSSSKPSPRQNKSGLPSSSRQFQGKLQNLATTPEQENPPATKKLFQKLPSPATLPNEKIVVSEQLPQNDSQNFLSKTKLSKSQENVLSGLPLDLCTSPPGSFESLLSEDDVFLPGSNERLNLLSPPLRTAFSSPCCGVRMAELRAVRRRSDSKSPSPEPPAPSPPLYLSFFQIPAAGHIETVAKQDVAVQTSPTKSPVRHSGKSGLRYMHTIIEEDHSDQTTGTNGRIARDRSSRLKSNSVSSPKSQINGKSKGTIDSSEVQFVRPIEMDGLHKESPETANLFDVISAADGHNLSRSSSTGKIKLSNILCTRGSKEDCANGTAARGDAADARASPSPPRPLKELTPVSSDADRVSHKSSTSMDSDKLNRDFEESGSHSMGSETESATPSPVPLQEMDTQIRRPAEVRPKGSKLRPPKPAKCIAARILENQQSTTITNQCREDLPESPRYSPQAAKGKASDSRPVVAHSKQPGEMLSNVMSADATSGRPLIKQASVRSIDSVGTSSNTTASGEEMKSADQQAPEATIAAAPTVPLKTSRGTTQQKCTVPPGNRGGLPEQKKVSLLKSQLGISATSGNGDTIDTIADGVPSNNGTNAVQISAVISDTEPANSVKSTPNSQPFLSRLDAITTTRHSSLSSSLTSSSSSVFSVADSESESSGIIRSRKDAFTSIGRPSNFSVHEGGEKSAKSSKPVSNEGKNLEKSRLAVPKISVNRSKERAEKTVSQKQDSPGKQAVLTNENCCDDDKKKLNSSAASNE